ncbi:hypothetical protein POJ06DRAFT_127238 [Lipomyces tetrasporus]|uniref:Large ribosomal subunit protein uL23m n=1 Tax=Lipomyces tetrasporus TaxID=54092 RepID=A0AAD7VRV5_9ASCO|nr:uncharacterized protein POJ06DRAFT_127238 [Lipomyces tetrasporus]KAJ8099069.1 hypothetical protein POJ06DRAFT_127238 [Lipomyces tetrasporus]
MPRKAPSMTIPSTTVLRQLYFQQTKPKSKYAPSQAQLDHEHRMQKFKERPKLPVVKTKYFRLGHNEVHFPKHSVSLLRPFSTDYNPYRATFRVPVTFNKFDLRDYLHHLYGLTVRKVYSNLKENRYKRTLAKFMTVEMDEPFIYPKLPDSFKPWEVDQIKEATNYMAEAAHRYGASSQDNKVFKAYEGVAQQKFPTIKPFIPKNSAKMLLRKAEQTELAFAPRKEKA